MNANGIRNVSRTQIASTARLSCEGCTKRKVKCDRLIPCTNCRNSSILCIPVERKRLPRGRSRRSVKSSSRAPLGRSDSHEGTSAGLVQSLEGGPSAESFVHTPNILLTQDLPFYPTHPTRSYFLACVITPIQEPDHTEGATFQTRQHNDLSSMIDDCAWAIPNGTMSAGRGALISSCRERQQLLCIYLTQVDPLVKILHRPSIQAHLLEGECYLNYEPWHPAPAALASAIYYAASCTVSQETCRSCFGMDKVSLITKYQKESTAALERADYLLTDDLTVLQAFVISLVKVYGPLSSRAMNHLLRSALNRQTVGCKNP
ncbi:hypothetical protein BDV24DRAFT_148752 [Aspergillus arachidicola]|uniref:Zn(2)-C6 fungal-type domain-containing protein n=1 Tax=Aspergillus arachidicola TaxID=656916 RepID=A0A5N6YHK5_9EURO|nr:hypothetical protein BDV24DRAFT_148752 [Aspergillus arachidicola]